MGNRNVSIFLLFVHIGWRYCLLFESELEVGKD